MADLPYAIIVDGEGNVTERKLADHDAGRQITTSVTIQSNQVYGGLRTVVLTRALKGVSSDHYTFDPLALSIDYINAIGSGPTFGYHKQKTSATISLWPVEGGSACVCKEPAAPFGQGKVRSSRFSASLRVFTSHIPKIRA